MTQTLREIIAANAFDGYAIEAASYVLEPVNFEDGLYRDIDMHVDHSAIERLEEQHKVDLVVLAGWTCADFAVGLRILRLDGRPVAIVWRASSQDDHNMTLLDQECHALLHSAWTAAKGEPEHETRFASDMILEMPVAAAGDETYWMQSTGNTPLLTAQGVAGWLRQSGGIDKVDHAPSLAHARAGLQLQAKREIKLSTQMREFYGDSDLSEETRADLAEMDEDIAAYKRLDDLLAARIAALG